MGIINVFKNDVKRILNEKSYLIIVLGTTVLTILLAVYFTSKFQIKGNIALVSNSNKFSMKSKYININLMKKQPAKSELIMGKYDAIVKVNKDGTFKIDTFKGKKFETMIKKAMEGSKINYSIGDTRKAGTNILGYLVMFILIEGTIFMKYFSEDKEIRTFKRILTSPVSMKSYLLGHCLFNFLMMYVPTFMILVFEKEVLRVNIGFSYLQYSYLLAIITLLSTAFGFFMSAIIEYTDDSTMMSSLIIVLTSTLAGSFYSFGSKNTVMDKLTKVLPQKSYMTLIQGIENKNNTLLNYPFQVIYLFVFIIALFIIGAAVCNKRFNEGKY